MRMILYKFRNSALMLLGEFK